MTLNSFQAMHDRVESGQWPCVDYLEKRSFLEALELGSRLEELEGEVESLESEVCSLNEDLDAHRYDLGQADDKISDLECIIETNEDQIKQLTKELAEAKERALQSQGF